MKTLRVVPFVVASFLIALLSCLGEEPFIVWFGALPLIVVAVVCTLISYAELPYEWGQQRLEQSRYERRRTWGILTTCIGLIVSTLWLNLPLRLSFALSSPLLGQIAENAKFSGNKGPYSALFFTVYDKTVVKGRTYLWIALPDESIGYCGYKVFAEGSPAQVRHDFPHQDVVTLNDEWSFVCESD